MTEPEYVYVKGQGWIVQYCESESTIVNGYLVTAYQRRPRVGECFYNYSHGVKAIIAIFNTDEYWRRCFSANPEGYISRFTENNHTYFLTFPDSAFVTVTVEKYNGR
jgi:hypothetical protein